jgi:putative transposase
MRSGRPKSELVLSTQEQKQLEALVHSRSLPAGLVRRAKIMLHAADGEANSAIAKRLKLTGATVGKWRRRFVSHRLQALHDELRPGRPRSLEDEAVTELN